MKTLFDTNIALDVLLKRPGWPNSVAAIAAAKDAWLSSLSVANICYIIGRSKTVRIRKPLDDLLARFQIGSVGGSTLKRARQLDYADFEDAIQFAVAEECRLQYLVTANISDFRSNAKVSVVSAAEFLAKH